MFWLSKKPSPIFRFQRSTAAVDVREIAHISSLSVETGGDEDYYKVATIYFINLKNEGQVKCYRDLSRESSASPDDLIEFVTQEIDALKERWEAWS